MKREVAEKWVAKLRSNEFVQGNGYLNDGSKFCCLGVLCEVAIEDGLDLKKVVPDDNDGLVFYGKGRDGAGLPVEVQQWAGFNDGFPTIHTSRGIIIQEYRDPNGEVPFHTMNDQLHYSFDDIADVIEESFVDR